MERPFPVEEAELTAYINLLVILLLDTHSQLNEAESRPSYRGKYPYIHWLRHEFLTLEQRIYSAVDYWNAVYSTGEPLYQ